MRTNTCWVWVACITLGMFGMMLTLAGRAIGAEETVAVPGSSAVSTVPSSSSQEGIVVIGKGSATAPAAVVELTAIAKAKAEASDEAVKKFHERRRRGLEALEALKNPALTITPQGFKVGHAVDPREQMLILQGGSAGPKEIEISEEIRLSLKDVDKLKAEELMDVLSTIIEAGREAGLEVGPPAPSSFYEIQMAMQGSGSGRYTAVFRPADANAMQEQAYKNAIEDAKAQAVRLAGLAGATLGDVSSIRTVDFSAGGPNLDVLQSIFAADPRGAGGDDVRSYVHGQISHTAHVQVTFRIAD